MLRGFKSGGASSAFADLWASIRPSSTHDQTDGLNPMNSSSSSGSKGTGKLLDLASSGGSKTHRPLQSTCLGEARGVGRSSKQPCSRSELDSSYTSLRSRDRFPQSLYTSTASVSSKQSDDETESTGEGQQQQQGCRFRNSHEFIPKETEYTKGVNGSRRHHGRKAEALGDGGRGDPSIERGRTIAVRNLLRQHDSGDTGSAQQAYKRSQTTSCCSPTAGQPYKQAEPSTFCEMLRDLKKGSNSPSSSPTASVPQCYQDLSKDRCFLSDERGAKKRFSEYFSSCGESTPPHDGRSSSRFEDSFTIMASGSMLPVTPPAVPSPSFRSSKKGVDGKDRIRDSPGFSMENKVSMRPSVSRLRLNEVKNERCHTVGPRTSRYAAEACEGDDTPRSMTSRESSECVLSRSSQAEPPSPSMDPRIDCTPTNSTRVKPDFSPDTASTAESLDSLSPVKLKETVQPLLYQSNRCVPGMVIAGSQDIRSKGFSCAGSNGPHSGSWSTSCPDTPGVSLQAGQPFDRGATESGGCSQPIGSTDEDARLTRQCLTRPINSQGRLSATTPTSVMVSSVDSHSTSNGVSRTVLPSIQHLLFHQHPPAPMTLNIAMGDAKVQCEGKESKEFFSPSESGGIAPSTNAYQRWMKCASTDGQVIEVPLVKMVLDGLPSLKLSEFELKATVGTGTFGRVRMCKLKNYKINSPLALKILKKSEVIRLKQVEHVKSEKDILKRIQHPFIVNLFATFQDSKSLFMVMEFVKGGELFSYLRKTGMLNNAGGRFYASEITMALEYLHSLDIVYRDLKPENLLIDGEGHIKITDFGFAKVVTERTWTVCGTPEYLAPEVIQSKGHGKSVDWWALGILIFEMLAGYPPFYDENPFGIYQKVLAGKINFPKHIDIRAKDLIKRLLSHDRAKRYGCLRGGAEDVKGHKWFKSIDWEQCLRRKLEPPFIPETKSPDDTSMFDQYPESTEGSAGSPLVTPAEQELFIDF